MVLNYIWIAFFLIGLLVAIIKCFGGHVEVFSEIVQSTFDTSETAFTISIGLTGILCLWMGIMKVGEHGGAINGMSRLISPFFRKLFPEIPKNHPAQGSMIINFAANMLGLDNAATPAGLKAMNEMQELNSDKDTASNAQIMFLVLNTSGLTLIPVTVMTYRSQFGAANPADIFIPILLSTFFASLIGLFIVAAYQKINLFNKVVLAYLGGGIAFVTGIVLYFSSLSPTDLEWQSKLASSAILYGIICLFITMALVKKVNVYESFIEGAKGGFEIAIKIIPFLVAILVSIGVFKASGAMGYLTDGMEWFFGLFTSRTEFVDGMPTAIMKPLSGGGARGMMLSSFEDHGVDSFVGRLTSIFQGATDTTFYIIAVYFGSVGIKKTRYAVKVGLMADLAGIISAILICYMFFGNTIDNKGMNPAIVEFRDAFNKNDFANLKTQNFTDITENKFQLSSFQESLKLNNGSILNDTSYVNKDTRTFIYKGDYKDKRPYFMDHKPIKRTFEFELKNAKIESIKYKGNFELEEMIINSSK